MNDLFSLHKKEAKFTFSEHNLKIIFNSCNALIKIEYQLNNPEQMQQLSIKLCNFCSRVLQFELIYYTILYIFT